MRALALLVVAGCAEPHMTLRAPAPNITPAQRVEMFHQLGRKNSETYSVKRDNGPWELTGAALVLGDGTKIELPEDLLPVVPADSDTARAARASADAGHRANTWMYIGFAAIAASATAVLVQDFGGTDLGISDDVLWAGAGLATVIPFLVAKHERGEEMMLRTQAFSTYTRDLGVRLNVCAHGLEVVACEAPLPPEAPSQAPGMAAPPVAPPAPAAPPPPAPAPAAAPAPAPPAPPAP